MPSGGRERMVAFRPVAVATGTAMLGAAAAAHAGGAPTGLPFHSA